VVANLTKEVPKNGSKFDKSGDKKIAPNLTKEVTKKWRQI
jgi:hypothetical protein